MSEICHLLTGEIAGAPVRFFASPLPEPDAPWCALADLLGAVGVPADRALRFFRFGARSVAVGGEVVQIIDRHQAEGLLAAASESERARSDLVTHLRVAIVDALNVQMSGWPEATKWAFSLAATMREARP